MNQILNHGVMEEKKSFIKLMKSRKLTASFVSQLSSLAVMFDVIVMMNHECKSKVALENDSLKSNKDTGIAIGFLLLSIQVFSTIFIAFIGRNQVHSPENSSGDDWLRKLKC